LKHAQAATLFENGRGIWHDNKKAFGHDIGRFGKIFDEADVFLSLDFQKIIGLFFFSLFKQGYVGPNIEFSRLNKNLNGKIERI
jgi:hypothetical protein